MAWALSPLSMQSFFDNNGVLIRPSRIYFYKPGTLDPVTVYQDSNLSVPHPQPVVSGGSGRVPPIYVGEYDYRVRVFDAYSNLVEDIPSLPGAQVDSGGGGGGSDTAIETGDIIWTMNNGQTRSGWVRLNGNTIGSAGSGATERANADAHNLFVKLWGQDDGTQFPISSGRGGSAEGDWLANKQLTLPDLRNMTLIGAGTMGRTERGLLNSAAITWSTGGASGKPGSWAGVGYQVMTLAQMPAHNHTLTDPGHNHSLSDPSHNHGVSQTAHAHAWNESPHGHPSSDPGHTHSYDRYTAAAGGGGGSGSIGNENRQTGLGYTGLNVAANVTGGFMTATTANVSNLANTTGITISGTTTGITLAANGSSAAQSNLQPSLVGTPYMRL